MAEALFWGLAAASTLLVGALVAAVLRPGPRVGGVILALGAGLLLGSVSFSLVDEALDVGNLGTVAIATSVALDAL